MIPWLDEGFKGGRVAPVRQLPKGESRRVSSKSCLQEVRPARDEALQLFVREPGHARYSLLAAPLKEPNVIPFAQRHAPVAPAPATDYDGRAG
jgi:hypothetical protein